eukprot:sb/3466614/
MQVWWHCGAETLAAVCSSVIVLINDHAGYAIGLEQVYSCNHDNPTFLNPAATNTNYTQGQKMSCSKLIAINDIISVERVDKYVFGHKYIIQILISKSSTDLPFALYMKLKTLNEVTEWISSLRKTCSKNTNHLNFYHPGDHGGKRWSCCSARGLTEQGCSKTHRSIILGDWRDPLNSDAEIQTIFCQLYNAKDCLRSKYLKSERLRHARSAAGDLNFTKFTADLAPDQRQRTRSVVNRRPFLKRSKKANMVSLSLGHTSNVPVPWDISSIHSILQSTRAKMMSTTAADQLGVTGPGSLIEQSSLEIPSRNLSVKIQRKSASLEYQTDTHGTY